MSDFRSSLLVALATLILSNQYEGGFWHVSWAVVSLMWAVIALVSGLLAIKSEAQRLSIHRH